MRKSFVFDKFIMIEYFFDKFFSGNLLLFVGLDKMISLMFSISIITVFVDLFLFGVEIERFVVDMDRTEFVIAKVLMLPIVILIIRFDIFIRGLFIVVSEFSL